MPDPSWYEWLMAKASILAKMPLNVLFAFGGVFLCFLTVPSARKAIHLALTVFCTPIVGILIYQFGVQWGWGQATISAVSFMGGFFTLAFCINLGKMHTAVVADDTLVQAALARLKRWIGGGEVK